LRPGGRGDESEERKYPAHQRIIRSLLGLKSTEEPPTVAGMSQPIEVELPHKLGKDEARRRIANNIHRLQEHIPGGAQVESGWAGDQLNLRVQALGDSVQSTIDVEETKVRVKVLLPGLLSMFAGPVQAMLQKKGDLLLEDHHKG
jgi:putative polyhydroxyalkanoate system protein